jgi:hypothetical protein
LELFAEPRVLDLTRLEFLAAQIIATRFADTFREFPPRQKAASFAIEDALEKMTAAATDGGTAKAAKAA